MRFRALVVLLAIMSAGLLTIGCAGNASPPPPVSAPKIVTAPVSQTVAAGQSATFNVTATGAAPLSYQWQKNGTALNGATSASYVTPPTNSFDNGAQFNVVVSNTSGSLATTAATLTVNSPPAITAQPSSQTVTAGQSATFSITATGSAPLSYQWNKNGAAISGATATTYTTPATATTDSGAQFTVVASNSFGNTASNAATLTVNPLTIAPAITSVNSLTLLVGTAGTFTVTATGAPTVSLAETGTLPSGVTFVDNGNGTGTLAGTPAAKSGKIYSITFTASNGVGTPATQSFALTVNEAPVFSSRNGATFNLGTSELFAVLTTGFPAPSLTETGALPSGVTFTDNGNGSGKLAGIATTGAGKTFPITFTASNGIGSPTTQSFALTVDQGPGISSPSNTAFTVGTPGSFAITTTGFPTPSLAETGALPAGVTFADNGNGVGTLSGTPASGTGGTYSIVFTATNGVGTPATQTFTLTVNTGNTGPAITSASSTMFTVGTPGTFSVTATGTPTPSLTEAGALPSGVTFKDNGNGTGTLSGTSAAGTGKTYSVTLTASNGVGSPASQTFILAVDQASAITSANGTPFTVGSSGSFTVSTTGFPAPSLTEAGTLPGGVTFVDNHNGTGTLSGTPATGTAGTYPVTFTANNGVGTATTQAFTLTVSNPSIAPVITSVSSTTFTVGTAGTFSVTATGTPTPSLTEAGALPSGVTLKDNGNGTGTLSGTPAAGTGNAYSITFVATNGVGSPVSQTFTLAVNQAPAISSPNSATFTVGSSGSFTVSTTGFPMPSLTETGALPSGVTFADNHNGTGTLSGTPATGTAGSYSITFTASNGVGTPTAQAFSLTVSNPSTGPVITSASSTTFTVGAAGTFTVTTTGSPTPTLTETGTLPSGVAFKDNGNGTATLSGTPTAGTGQTYSITFTATNGVGSPASQTFALTVNQAPAITSPNNTSFNAGTSASFTLLTTGFPTPSVAETGALPSGVTFADNHNGSGTLSGTPASGTAGTYSVTLTASNGVGTPASQTFTLTVNQAPAITSPNSTAFNAGTSGSFTVLTTGFPTPSVTQTGALPSGVTFKENGNGTATLSGTPASASAGTYSLTFTASNGVGTPATQAFTLTVNPANAAPVITSATSTTFTVGTAGTFSVTTTGTPTPSLTETGALPGGVTFTDNGNGSATLSGTPASGSANTYSLTFTASNGVGTPASQTFTLTVNPANAAPVITSVTSATFTVGTAGTFSVTTTGTPTPSLTETGALPTGVTFTDNGNGTATLSGTPAAGTAATYSLTLTATNGVGTPATQAFTLTVSTGSSITCGTGHESVLSGQYAFFFQGFDANGPVAIAGTFSANGTGKVALISGVEDIDSTIGAQTNVAIDSAGSSYSVGADNRGCLTIATASGTSKYAISLGSLTTNVSGRGRMMEIDSTGTLGSGELRLVTATTAITGGFNFGVSSTESVSSTTPNRFAMAGSFTASGGTITAGEADFNLSGSVDGGAAGPLAITNGSYTLSSNGRGTLTFDVSGAGTFNMAIYIISAKEFTLVNIGAPSVTNPPFGGAAHQQSGTFSTASLTGNSVFYSAGLCLGCGPGSTAAADVSMGVITVSTAGSFTLTGDQNQAGTLTSLSDSGTYAVDASGRAVLQGGRASPYIVYLETTGRGFLLTTGSEVGIGFTDLQKGGPFTNASLTATLSFGTASQTEQNVIDSSGVETFNGLGAVSGTTDSASLGSGSSSNAFNQTYSITNSTDGRGTITSGGATVSIFYMISTSHIVLMDASSPSGSANSHPAITISR